VRLARAFRGLLTPVSAGITLALIAVAVVDGLDENKVSQALEHLRRVIQDGANMLPPHGEFVRQCCGHSNAAIPPAEFVL